MLIHKVKKGETVYSIAEGYGVSPKVIIENNALSYPDRLPIGRELLILMPTKTYTSRRGDEIEKVCKRFSLEKEELLRNNPSLSAMAKIYPEEIFSIRYPEKSHGLIFTNGYLYDGCSTDKLSSLLRYLSEVTLCSSIYEKNQVRNIFDARRFKEFIKKKGKKLNLRIYLKGPLDENYFNESSPSQFLKAAKSIEADGIILPIPASADQKALISFIENLYEILKNEQITLTLEYTKDTPVAIESSCDRKIICRDGTLERLLTQQSDELKFYTEICPKIKAERTMLDLSPFAYRENKGVDLESMLMECDRNLKEIYEGPDGMILYFGEGAKRCVMPSLKYIKAKLDLVGELGFMGVCIDIMRCPRSHIMMLSSLFHIC